MQVSGVVLHLVADARAAAEALRAVRAEPGVELGPAQDARRVPAVLEAESPERSKALLRRLEAVDGMLRVEVAFVSLPDARTEPINEPGDR